MTVGSYYEQHKDRIKARSKARYEANKKKCIEEGSKRRKANPKKFEEYRQNWYRKNPLYHTYHNAKKRARHLGLPFDLDWKDLVIPEYCPILGMRMNKELNFDHRPSLDRIDPSKGYVKGNVAFISMKANRMKQEGTAEEHRKIADYIDSYTI